MTLAKKGGKPKSGVNPASSKTTAKAEELAGPRLVTYALNTNASKGDAKKSNLSMPYAVAINGVIMEEFKSSPKRVSGDGGKIRVRIPPENASDEDKRKYKAEPVKVSLYLNSDARPGPGFRQHPVYEVTLKPEDDSHVLVKITEKLNKHSDEPRLTQSKPDKKTNTEVYEAALTGDIWMLVSHKYTADEAKKVIPGDTLPHVRDAVVKIYEGLPEAKLTFAAPSFVTGGEPRAIQVVFQDDDDSDPNANIMNGYTLVKEGLPRVHPAGFAALFTAAVESGIDYVRVASNWRPCLGSIAHRAGLGLDVGNIDTLKIDRSQLLPAKAPTTKPPAPNASHGNVTAEEQKRFRAFDAARRKTKALATDKEAKKKRLERAIAEDQRIDDETEKAPPSALEDAKLAKDMTRRERQIAQRLSDDAEEAWRVATLEQSAARKAWWELGDSKEPWLMYSFRQSLASSQSVKELFDPWLVDSNARDAVAATPNTLAEGNEMLHRHHLHITVNEPVILSRGDTKSTNPKIVKKQKPDC